VLFWLHLVSTGLFLGSTAGIPLFTIPGARGAAGGPASRTRLARALRVYDPLAIALLGVMVMTGAWSVTAYKQSLGQEYFASFGAHLVWKLSAAFLTVMAGTYVTFGLGHRLVRAEDLGDPVDEARLASMMSRLSGAAWATVGLTGITIAIALRGAGGVG
jgi:hypothetical protein